MLEDGMSKSFTGVGPEPGPRAVYLDSAGISLNSSLSGYHGIFRRHPGTPQFYGIWRWQSCQGQCAKSRESLDRVVFILYINLVFPVAIA